MVRKRGLMVDFKRILSHSIEFYKSRFSSIVVGFSIPLILAYTVLLLAQVPSYPALGAVFLRTISIPELSITDFIIIGVALVFSNFVVADAITNINILIKRKRTLNEVSSEVWEGIVIYATKIFNVFLIMFLLMLLFQLLTFEMPTHSIVYPLLLLIVGFLMFFAPPAIVIDNEDTLTAIVHSVELIRRLPLFYVPLILAWALIGVVSNTVVGLIAFSIFSAAYAPYLIILINSVIIYPFLIALQTHMYMEKYPLAK